MGLERVEVSAPVTAMAIEPRVELGEPVAPQRVDAALGVDAHVDEPRFAEHAKVTGYGGLGERGKGRAELARGDAAEGELVEKGATRAIGNGLEGVHGGLYMQTFI